MNFLPHIAETNRIESTVYSTPENGNKFMQIATKFTTFARHVTVQ